MARHTVEKALQSSRQANEQGMSERPQLDGRLRPQITDLKDERHPPQKADQIARNADCQRRRGRKDDVQRPTAKEPYPRCPEHKTGKRQKTTRKTHPIGIGCVDRQHLDPLDLPARDAFPDPLGLAQVHYACQDSHLVAMLYPAAGKLVGAGARRPAAR